MSCLALTACHKELSIPIPDAEKKPVLNALFSEDSVIYARASLSGRWTRQMAIFQPDSFSAPEGAIVKLYEDGVYQETLQPFSFYTTAFFRSTHKVQKGRQYRLSLEVPGYPIAEGIDTVPDRNTFTVSEQKVYEMPADGDSELNFSFILHNTGNRPAHYVFKAYMLYNYTTTEQGQTVIRYERQQLWLGDKNAPPDIIFDKASHMFMGLLSGQSIPPGFRQLYVLRSSPRIKADSLVLEVNVLSDAAWQYLSTYDKALQTLDDPTAEKVNVFGNVQNGFGIVGATASKEYLLLK